MNGNGGTDGQLVGGGFAACRAVPLSFVVKVWFGDVMWLMEAKKGGPLLG